MATFAGWKPHKGQPQEAMTPPILFSSCTFYLYLSELPLLVFVLLTADF